MDISESATLLRRESLMMCSTSPNFFCFGQGWWWGNLKKEVGYSPVDIGMSNARKRHQLGEHRQSWPLGALHAIWSQGFAIGR
jgi:hypothetical protein